MRLLKRPHQHPHCHSLMVMRQIVLTRPCPRAAWCRLSFCCPPPRPLIHHPVSPWLWIPLSHQYHFLPPSSPLCCFSQSFVFEPIGLQLDVNTRKHANVSRLSVGSVAPPALLRRICSVLLIDHTWTRSQSATAIVELQSVQLHKLQTKRDLWLEWLSVYPSVKPASTCSDFVSERSDSLPAWRTN